MVKEYFGEGIGLYRTEYLYLNAARMPTEQEQFLDYKTWWRRWRRCRWSSARWIWAATNRWPAIRICSRRRTIPSWGSGRSASAWSTLDIFKDQLRAILRASAHGKVRMMYPMISGAEELARANAVLEECKAELKREGRGVRRQDWRWAR
jgi:phosphotransferase system enzyme I (PtsI)